MKNLITISFAVLMLSMSMSAQENKEVKTSKLQISFGYPLGTHGSDRTYSNDISFNILYGLNKGVNGFELGGILNYNNGNVNGVQIAGGANINMFNVKGVQIAPANITYGNVEGVQFGTLNLAKRVKGLQIGIINYRENGDDGLSLGIFNIIKNGYYAIESTAGEVMYINTNFKMGSKKLYTIFKLGYSRYKSKSVYSYGIGLGRIFKVSKKTAISTDLSFNKIVYDNDWSPSKNDLYKLDVNYNLKLGDKFSIIAGPSINYYNTNKKIDGEFGTLKIPYTISEKINGNSKKSFWIGANVGLNYKF